MAEIAEQEKHAFKIHFSYQNTPYTALLTISQKNDHDEYHVTPDDTVLLNKYGSLVINNYFDQKDPFRSQHVSDDYMNSIIKGIQEFLNSKHS
jgi:hypothetical protein